MQGEFDRAVAYYKQSIALEPDFGDAYNRLGEIYLKLGRLDEAMETYRRAVQLNPNQPSTYHGLGQTYSKQGNYEEAVAAYKKALEIKGDYTEAHYNLGQVYIKLAQKEMALFEKLQETTPLLVKTQQFIKHHPDDPKAYHNLGIIYARRERYDLAIENYKKAIALSPHSAKIHYNLGLVYEDLHQFDLAIESYKKAIHHDPKLATAYNNLAMRYAEQELHLDEALKLAKTAVQLTPQEHNHLDTLAWIYYRKQMYTKAEQALTKAIELAPGEGSYLKRLNEIQAAREQEERSGGNGEVGK